MKKTNWVYIVVGLALIIYAGRNLFNMFVSTDKYFPVKEDEQVITLEEPTEEETIQTNTPVKVMPTIWEGIYGSIDFQKFPKTVSFKIPDFERTLSLRFKGNYYQKIEFIPDDNLGECREKIWRVGVIPLKNGSELHFTHSGLCHWGPMMGDLFRRPVELGPLGSKGYIDSYRKGHLDLLLGIHPCYDEGSGWICFDVKEVRHLTPPESEMNNVEDIENLVSKYFDMTNRSVYLITCSSDGGIISPSWNNRIIIRMEIDESFVPD